jgi:hypothetical protein
VSNYFDRYKTRMNASGSSMGNTFKNSTIDFINKSFKDSPNYKQVDINGVTTDVRIVDNENKSNEKTLLFKPGIANVYGENALIDSENWLVVEYFKDEIHPKATIHRCNNTITITTDGAKTKIGETEWGEPVYDTSSGTTYNFPCVIKSLREMNDTDNESNEINIIESRIVLIISSSTDANNVIKENTEFSMFSNVYRVYSFDRSKIYNDKGLLVVLADKI